MFGITGKTDFNTHIIRKSGYSFAAETFATNEFFVIDDTATSNDFFAIGSQSTVKKLGI